MDSTFCRAQFFDSYLSLLGRFMDFFSTKLTSSAYYSSLDPLSKAQEVIYDDFQTLVMLYG